MEVIDVPQGKCEVNVRYKDITRRMEMTVVPGVETRLFGLTWTIEMSLMIPATVVQVNQVRRTNTKTARPLDLFERQDEDSATTAGKKQD
ncbi:hypothetical protein ACOME3_009239 [Neoechinorhynchus agilis]